jgi:hypothetical protein
MKTYLIIGVFVAIPVVFRIIRSLRPLRISSSDPSRFAGVGRSYAIHTVTGRAHDVSKTMSTQVSGGVSSTISASGGVGSVTGRIRSTTTTHDQLMITDATGGEHAIQVNGFHLAVANNQLVSAVWAVRKGKKSGAYFLVVNHDTKGRFFKDQALDDIIINHKITGNILIIAAVLFLPFAFILTLVWAVTYRMQRSRFKKSGVNPLIKALETTAARMPARSAGPSQPRSTADELSRLAKMAQDGLLTDDEFTQAKSQLLGPSPER